MPSEFVADAAGVILSLRGHAVALVVENSQGLVYIAGFGLLSAVTGVSQGIYEGTRDLTRLVFRFIHDATEQKLSRIIGAQLGPTIDLPGSAAPATSGAGVASTAGSLELQPTDIAPSIGDTGGGNGTASVHVQVFASNDSDSDFTVLPAKVELAPPHTGKFEEYVLLDGGRSVSSFDIPARRAVRVSVVIKATRVTSRQSRVSGTITIPTSHRHVSPGLIHFET